MAAMHHKHLFGFVAMLGIDATTRLARTPDIKAMRDADMNILPWLLGNTRTDQAKILLLVAAGGARIDKGIGARPHFIIADKTLPHFS
ncbi:MAG: hypothetical protein Tsb0016_20660 [Sphingomonadales bacterium]